MGRTTKLIEFRIAKDVVVRCPVIASLGLFAGGEFSLWPTRFSLGFSVFADGGGHEAYHDDTWTCFT